MSSVKKVICSSNHSSVPWSPESVKIGVSFRSPSVTFDELVNLIYPFFCTFLLITNSFDFEIALNQENTLNIHRWYSPNKHLMFQYLIHTYCGRIEGSYQAIQTSFLVLELLLSYRWYTEKKTPWICIHLKFVLW